MKVRLLPSAERFRASSDLELKLVTIWLLGTCSSPSKKPKGLRFQRTIGEETPKLGSLLALFQTLWLSLRFGASPLSLAYPQLTVTAVVPVEGGRRGTFTVAGLGLVTGPVFRHPCGNISPGVTVPAFPT